MRPSRFSGKSSGIETPKASRRFFTPSPYSDSIALPETWRDSSFKVRLSRAVVSWATKRWPGTSVVVRATSGMAVPKKSPPASVVRLRSWVYRAIRRQRAPMFQSSRRTSWRVRWGLGWEERYWPVPVLGAGQPARSATAFGSRSAGGTYCGLAGSVSQAGSGTVAARSVGARSMSRHSCDQKKSSLSFFSGPARV